MIKGTTPPITLRVTNGGELDLTAALNVYVSLRQGGMVVTKSGEDLAIVAQAVTFSLSQQDSLRLNDGPAEVQINWTYLDADTGEKRRAATKVRTIQIGRQLLTKVV